MSAQASSFVTYALSEGRFGDNLLAYCHAKWISYKTNVPLLYRPFIYSDQLYLHTAEKKYSLQHQDLREYTYYHSFVEIERNAQTVYIVPFFPESPLEICLEPFNAYYFAVDWHDPLFKQELRTMIRPISEFVPHIQLPNDHICVAMHVRKGTNFDRILGIDVKNLTDWNKGPLLFKIPPDSYYIDQLKRVADIYNGQPLWVYLFTDHNNPVELAEYYQSQLRGYPIIFEYRNDENRHDLNVLEDFFSMVFLPFDCLIRPESHYSFVASKIGKFKLVISPKSFFYEDKKAFINEVCIDMCSS